MDPRISSIESQIVELQGRLRALRARLLGPIEKTYAFATATGVATLHNLFNEKTRLLVVHNMGVSCEYCQAYADGFNGVLPHLLRYCSVAVASPDPVAAQRAKASERGWTFPMISTLGTSFTKDMGFGSAAEGWWPGVSALELAQDGGIARVGVSSFEPGDAFSPIWPSLQLFDPSAAAWPPQ